LRWSPSFSNSEYGTYGGLRVPAYSGLGYRATLATGSWSMAAPSLSNASAFA
jgi:hypothetical protein